MVRLVSGQTKMVSLDCATTVGKVSNTDHLNRVFFLKPVENVIPLLLAYYYSN